MRKFVSFVGASLLVGMCLSSPSLADQTAATMAALQMAGTVTGGLMPSTDPEFTQMVNFISSGDYMSAAQVAANSQYCTAYLIRRMAKEMMSPGYSAAGVSDNDATTFIVANLAGSGTQANISKLWSNNLTCLVNVTSGTTTTATHALSLTASQLAAVNWNQNIVCTAGQTAGTTAIPLKHVGGYVTLSNAINDGSYAEFAFTAGTNLRGIEGIWEIATNFTLPQLVAANGEMAQYAPRFVPENDPNFFIGQGQPACISCHGGGASNVTHGYSTVADKFNFDPTNGFEYIATPTTSTMKSLGSNASTRQQVLTCNLAQFQTCNPDSQGADPNQAWDLTTWQKSGMLAQWGWSGPITGQGLNALGQALGQATIVYQVLVQRVISEICPGGSISAAQQASIAQQAQAQDSFAYIVAAVASDPSCR